mmetsp:Transcript_23597/g.75746  ORF Transcript_23597/g.75746 Transcript_23597/m.75746 type:complete len:378 (+) Transcript_23597:155-1288(+)
MEGDLLGTMTTTTNPLTTQSGSESESDDESAEGATTSRLAQLQSVAASRRSSSYYDNQKEHDIADVEEGVEMKDKVISLSGNESPNAEFMALFFKEVEEVKDGIRVVQTATKRIREITEERMMATSAGAEQELSLELTGLVDRANGRTKKTKALLEKISEDTKAQQGDLRASETRIRENLCNTLHRKFVDVAKEYQKQQQSYRAEITKTVKRQLEIVKPDVSTEEIDDVMRRGGAGDVYRAAIVAGTHDPIQSAYADVADKYADVLKLEQSVQELHQMFMDFALLTEQQGELLDQIEYQVKSAGEYVEEGNVDIEQAIVYQREIRKRWVCLVIIVIILLVVILAVAGVFDQGDDKEKKKITNSLSACPSPPSPFSLS